MRPSLQPTSNTPEMAEKLPAGVFLRHPDRRDIEAIAKLIVLVDLADRGESDVSLEDVALDWQRPQFDPNQDAWLAIAAPAAAAELSREQPDDSSQPLVRDGLLVGYEEVTNRDRFLELRGDGYVHPDYLNQGIGTALLRTMEKRACQWLSEAQPGQRVVLRNGVSASDHLALDLHQAEGYHPERYYWLMEIDLDQQPTIAIEPPGSIQIRNFIPDQDDRRLFEAMQEAFQDHWAFTPWDYDWWHTRMVGREAFEPGLWFLAVDGHEIAGASLGRLVNGQGWISQLAVRRSWRQRGLGLALLQRSLLAFQERQVNRVGLAVDAANPTGATRLYEKAGMSAVHQYILYEKVLQPGTEPEA